MSTPHEDHAFERSQRIQDFERIGTGILGWSIIGTMILIPAIVIIFLVYFLLFH